MHCEKIKKKHVMDNIFYSNDVQRTSFNEKPLKPSLFIFTDNEANLRYTIVTLHDFGDHFFIIVFQYLYISQQLALYFNVCTYHNLTLYSNICTSSLYSISICVHITIYHSISNICTYHSV